MSTGKLLSNEDIAALVDLMERNGADAVIQAARAISRTSRKVGRPAGHVGNLAGVFGYVEFHRRTIGPGGKKLGVDPACAKLRRLLDRWTVNCRTSAGRLRTMYYEAISLAKRDASFGEQMRRCLASYEQSPTPDTLFPLLLISTERGELAGPIIDTLGLGGRPVEKKRLEIVR